MRSGLPSELLTTTRPLLPDKMPPQLPHRTPEVKDRTTSKRPHDDDEEEDSEAVLSLAPPEALTAPTAVLAAVVNPARKRDLSDDEEDVVAVDLGQWMNEHSRQGRGKGQKRPAPKASSSAATPQPCKSAPGAEIADRRQRSRGAPPSARAAAESRPPLQSTESCFLFRDGDSLFEQNDDGCSDTDADEADAQEPDHFRFTTSSLSQGF